MGDTPAPTEGTSQEQPQETEASGGFEAITSQEQLDKIISKRLERERAKYADYEALKAAAEAASTKEAEQAKALEEALETVKMFEHDKEVREWTLQVAEEFKVPAEALRGATLDELKAHAEVLQGLSKPSMPVIPGVGSAPQKFATDEQQFIRKLFSQ